MLMTNSTIRIKIRKDVDLLATWHANNKGTD